MRKLRADASREAIDKRFVSVLLAASFADFLYQLRQLVKLAKAKKALPVDFAALAEDLYWYQIGAREKVCLRWAEAYYRIEKKKEDK